MDDGGVSINGATLAFFGGIGTMLVGTVTVLFKRVIDIYEARIAEAKLQRATDLAAHAADLAAATKREEEWRKIAIAGALSLKQNNQAMATLVEKSA